jgi:hypothetical protein
MINQRNKQTTFFGLLAAVLVLTFGLSSPGAYALNGFGDGLDKKRDNVEAMFDRRTGRDPRAQGSAWPEAMVFAVGVDKNMGHIPEYADYVCNVLADHELGGKGITVEIVDIDRLFEARGGWKALAKVQCK